MKDKSNLITGILILIIIIISILLINNQNKKTGELKQITYKQILQKVEKKEDFILIVSKSNCSHCMSYKPKVEIIAKDYNITVYYIDFDKEKEKDTDEFLKEFKLDGSTPMTLFIKDGKETSILKRLEGDVESNKIINRFKEMGFLK